MLSSGLIARLSGALSPGTWKEGIDHMQPLDVEARQTYFAPAHRASVETLAEQIAALFVHPVFAAILDSFSGHALVLNRDRQILAASSEFREALAACGMHEFVGKRPGEVLGCEHAGEGPGGCGTSLSCSHCGAVMAILAAQCCGSPAYEECWIGMRRNHKRESIELRAKATPMTLAGLELVVLALQDISDQKRRTILEQSFLHDARNLLGAILAWSEVLVHEPSAEAAVSIRSLAMQLREQLNGHKLLQQAEKGSLVVVKTPLDLPALARAINDTYSAHPCGEGKGIVVQFPQESAMPTSDRNLVMRILSNMVTNALEATREGGTVTVRYAVRDGVPTFTVHNPGVIAEEVAERVFQRSFSTKTEPGHGLGTYSMRLFAEDYLGGRVSFTSTDASGTTFTLTLPAG
jgi:hypothetical protein